MPDSTCDDSAHSSETTDQTRQGPPDAAAIMYARHRDEAARVRAAIADFLSDAVCQDCSRPASIATTIVADTDAALPAPVSPKMLCAACSDALVREGRTRGWTVANTPLTHRPETTEQLDALVDAVGMTSLAGYHVGGLDAVTMSGRHPVALAGLDGQLWLLSEVGRDGYDIYPEDDLEDELDSELPAEHQLWWDEYQERAVLARRLTSPISAETLKDAISAFEQLASNVENRLTSPDGLGLQPSSSAEELLATGPLVPPSGDEWVAPREGEDERAEQP